MAFRWWVVTDPRLDAGWVWTADVGQLDILGQKRNAAYETYIVYEGLSLISRKRLVTVLALILGLWVLGVVLAIIVNGQNWFISLNLRFYRSWCRVIRRWRHECARSDIVPICQKRFLRRLVILALHQNYWAITDGVTLACNILIVFSRSTCVRFGIVNKKCVTFNFKF